MPREAGLFDTAGGSPVEAFFLLREEGGNIPPMWIERASESRKNREERLAELLAENSLDAASRRSATGNSRTARNASTTAYGCCSNWLATARASCDRRPN